MGCVLDERMQFLAPVRQKLLHNFFSHKAFDVILNITLALAPLRLPTYVIWWIAEWLPEALDHYNKMWLDPCVATTLIANINENFWCRHEENSVKKAKKLSESDKTYTTINDDY